MVKEPKSIKRTRERKLERQQSLHKLVAAIETHSMTPGEKSRLLERIMRETIAGVITPTEAKTVTKAVRILS